MKKPQANRDLIKFQPYRLATIYRNLKDSTVEHDRERANACYKIIEERYPNYMKYVVETICVECGEPVQMAYAVTCTEANGDLCTWCAKKYDY